MNLSFWAIKLDDDYPSMEAWRDAVQKQHGCLVKQCVEKDFTMWKLHVRYDSEQIPMSNDKDEDYVWNYFFEEWRFAKHWKLI